MYRLNLSILLVLGSLSLMGAGSPAGAMEETSITTEPDLEIAFNSWAEALEARVNSDSPWDFPFGAPKPSDLSGPDLETVLTLRRLAQTRDLDQLESWVERVARRTEPLPVQMKFWLAYGFSLLHRNQACLGKLLELLEGPDNSHSLENGQLVWVLTGTCDNLFLLDRRVEATALYGRLAASPVEQLNLWGNYQLAGSDFLARNFTEADRRYKLVCDSERAATWREHACEMASIAEQLATLRTEGMGHGIAANDAP
jgi:hypothetical protein